MSARTAGGRLGMGALMPPLSVLRRSRATIRAEKRLPVSSAAPYARPMDWVNDFYSRTGHWWGEAEAGVGSRHRGRVEVFPPRFGTGRGRVLELGCGYGNTAAAFAEAGHE